MNKPYIGYKLSGGTPSAPLPIQLQADGLRAKHKHILFAGSFGVGKTEWLCLNMVADALRFPGNRILTGRKKLDWFKSSTLPILLDAIPPELLIRHDKQDHYIQIRTSGKPSEIHYRQLDATREAVNQIKSMNLGLFAPDQAEDIDKEVFTAAIGRLRKNGTARQSLSTVNPAGHNWVWKTWVNKEGGKEYGYVEGRMWTRGVPPPRSQKDVTFATTDNIYLAWDYIASLLNDYPERWLNRYVYCEWDSYEGLVYPEWRADVHVIKPFKIPEWWDRYIAMDHGHRNPTAIGWFAVDGDGNLYLYDLHYKSGEWVDYHSEMIRIKSAQNGTDLDKVKAWIADSSIFSEQTEVTIADEYYENGISWSPANKDVEGGINRCATYLKLDKNLANKKFPEGKPKFFVFGTEACHPFIEEIGEYHYEDITVTNKNAPERPHKHNDHAMDMWRYMINYLEASEKPKKKKDPYGDFLPYRRQSKLSYMAV